jgi:hypothetical protein
MKRRPDDQIVDVAFIKIFLMNESTNLSKMEQGSPFKEERQYVPVPRMTASVWGTFLIPVVQRRTMNLHRNTPN